jgi:hypothetical protein
MGFLTTLLKNLVAGLRLLVFLPVAPHDLYPSLRQVVILGGLAGAVWMVFDRIIAGGDAQFLWPGVAQIAWIAVVFACALLWLSPAGRNPDAAALVLTALAAMLPGYFLIVLPAVHFSRDTPAAAWIGIAVTVLSAIYLARIVRLVLGGSVPIALASGVAVAGVTWLAFGETVFAKPLLWKARDDANASVVQAEELMFRQPLQIESALAKLEPQREGTTDIYFLGFAGDGKQSVFGTEVAYARAALARKLDIEGRSIALVNTPEPDGTTPVATGSGLRFTLERLGQIMNPQEDVLVLFLTSHGTRSAKIAVSQKGWALQDLSASALADALRASGIKWRVVIISACYSGSFVDQLKDENTVVVTAASADRQSFGCRDNRDLTYYGEALFRDALPTSASLLEAVDKAREVVTAREEREDFKPSQPQTFVGEQMRTKLSDLAFAPPAAGP